MTERTTVVPAVERIDTAEDAALARRGQRRDGAAQLDERRAPIDRAAKIQEEIAALVTPVGQNEAERQAEAARRAAEEQFRRDLAEYRRLDQEANARLEDAHRELAREHS